MNRKRFKHLSAVALLTMSASIEITAAEAKTTTYAVEDPKHEDLVSFTSDAPVELIVGHTNRIKGEINLDDSLDLSKKPLDATFAVDLPSIDTGIELRNEHMRDNFLETKKYPSAIFKISSLAGNAPILRDGIATRVIADGEFTLHGKTVKKQIPVAVTFYKRCPSQQKFASCNLLQIKSTFNIALQEFGIQRPQVVFQKLANTVVVTVSATAHHQAAVSERKP